MNGAELGTAVGLAIMTIIYDRVLEREARNAGIPYDHGIAVSHPCSAPSHLKLTWSCDTGHCRLARRLQSIASCILCVSAHQPRGQTMLTDDGSDGTAAFGFATLLFAIFCFIGVGKVSPEGGESPSSAKEADDEEAVRQLPSETAVSKPVKQNVEQQ